MINDTNEIDDTVDFSSDTVDFSSDTVSEAEKKEPEMIDNSKIFYVPFRLTCGIEVKARPGVLSNCSKVST